MPSVNLEGNGSLNIKDLKYIPQYLIKLSPQTIQWIIFLNPLLSNQKTKFTTKFQSHLPNKVLKITFYWESTSLQIIDVQAGGRVGFVVHHNASHSRGKLVGLLYSELLLKCWLPCFCICVTCSRSACKTLKHTPCVVSTSMNEHFTHNAL